MGVAAHFLTGTFSGVVVVWGSVALCTVFSSAVMFIFIIRLKLGTFRLIDGSLFRRKRSCVAMEPSPP